MAVSQLTYTYTRGNAAGARVTPGSLTIGGVAVERRLATGSC